MSNFLNYYQTLQLLQNIKAYVDGARPEDVISQITFNGNVLTPDPSGNVNIDFTLPQNLITADYAIWTQNQFAKEQTPLSWLNANYGQSDPLITKSYLDNWLPDVSGVVKSVSVNGGTHNAPDSDGNVDLTIDTYTLELDKGAGSVTASIDNGSPVSPDSNNNINLDIPDNYINSFTAYGKNYQITNHSMDLGYPGRPRFYANIRSKMTSDSTPAFFFIECNEAIVSLSGATDNTYVKIVNKEVVDAKGEVWIFKSSTNGHFSNGFFIACKLDLMLEIITLGTYGWIKVCTNIVDNEPTFEGGEIDYTTWERSISTKAIFPRDFTSYNISRPSWIYKPVIYRSDYDDNNTLYPGMIYDVIPNLTDDYADTKGSIPLNWGSSPNLKGCQYVFRNCYVGTMKGNDEVRNQDWNLRMPLYSISQVSDGWILLDFVLEASNKTRDTRNYHCTVRDWDGNVMFDIRINEFNSSSTDYDATKEYHIYKRVKLDKNKRYWKETEA